MAETRGCAELRPIIGTGENCCYSCHDDADDGYGDLFEDELDGITYRVCCAMSRNLERFIKERGAA